MRRDGPHGVSSSLPPAATAGTSAPCRKEQPPATSKRKRPSGRGGLSGSKRLAPPAADPNAGSPDPEPPSARLRTGTGGEAAAGRQVPQGSPIPETDPLRPPRPPPRCTPPPSASDLAALASRALAAALREGEPSGAAAVARASAELSALAPADALLAAGLLDSELRRSLALPAPAVLLGPAGAALLRAAPPPFRAPGRTLSPGQLRAALLLLRPAEACGPRVLSLLLGLLAAGAAPEAAVAAEIRRRAPALSWLGLLPFALDVCAAVTAAGRGGAAAALLRDLGRALPAVEARPLGEGPFPVFLSAKC